MAYHDSPSGIQLIYTPPKTNMSSEKGPFQQERILFQTAIFKGDFRSFSEKVGHSNSPTYTFNDCGGLLPRPSFPHPPDVVTQVGGVQHDLLEEGREKVPHCEGT